MNTNGRIFVALNGLGKAKACEFVSKLTNLSNPYVAAIAGFKIEDLWDEEGPGIIENLEYAGGGSSTFVDLKLHTTPKTAGFRAKAARRANAGFLTVHALGGIEMMKAAVESGPRILAITILTSHSESEVRNRFRRTVYGVVSELAWEAKQAGVWGVVCSANEVGILANNPELKGLKFVVPGIRLAGKEATDKNQKRVNTPAVAFAAGATYIVVGSELTKAEDPVSVLGRIEQEILDVPEKGASQ